MIVETLIRRELSFKGLEVGLGQGFDLPNSSHIQAHSNGLGFESGCPLGSSLELRGNGGP